jgi:hypothetical protein
MRANRVRTAHYPRSVLDREGILGTGWQKFYFHVPLYRGLVLSDSQVLPVLLSDWLRRSGSLTSGDVRHVRIEQELETSISKLSFITVTYSADAPAHLPRQLVVKSPLNSARNRTGPNREVDFYRGLAPLVGTPPLVRCLASLEESDDHPETIVLEDLRGTHDHPPWPLPPSRFQSELAVDVLARVHAQWWEAPTLGQDFGELHTSESLTTMVHGVAAHLPGFFDAVGDSLTPEARRVLERVFSSSLRPWLRLTESRALTVAHGDAHSWNFLFPRSNQGSAFLIDWQLWHLDLGVRDLAFLVALHWFPDRRHTLEEPLLRYYHRALQANHIDNYPFDELWLDYRRCVVRNLTIPIIFWSRGMKPEGWWHRLECSLAAYADLECEDLL